MCVGLGARGGMLWPEDQEFTRRAAVSSSVDG